MQVLGTPVITCILRKVYVFQKIKSIYKPTIAARIYGAPSIKNKINSSFYVCTTTTLINTELFIFFYICTRTYYNQSYTRCTVNMDNSQSHELKVSQPSLNIRISSYNNTSSLILTFLNTRKKKILERHKGMILTLCINFG